jgi:hypothetical protein
VLLRSSVEDAGPRPGVHGVGVHRADDGADRIR